MNKIDILKKAGITSDFEKYEIEEGETSYKIYKNAGQTQGCVLVGKELKDINNDGLIDVTNSVATMTILNSLLPKNFELEII